jgi:hypothetical protein
MSAALVMPIAAVIRDQDVSPGVLGFTVVALLGVATWLLVRSMQRQIKKIDIPDEGTPTNPAPGAPAEPDRATRNGRAGQDSASEDG